MIKVRASVFDNYWQGETEVVVGEDIFRKVMVPLDIPSPNADAIQRMFCSDAATIKMVMTDREVLAKEIAQSLTQQLLDFMSQQDTVMGYKVVSVAGTQKAPDLTPFSEV